MIGSGLACAATGRVALLPPPSGVRTTEHLRGPLTVATTRRTKSATSLSLVEKSKEEIMKSEFTVN